MLQTDMAPIPCVLSIFDCRKSACLLEDLERFLVCLCEGNTSGLRVVHKSDVERAVTSYCEEFIREDEPEGFSKFFAKGFCDTCFKDDNLSVDEIKVEDLKPYLSALETEYKNPISPHLWQKRHPPHVGLGILLPHDELKRGEEIAYAVLKNYQSVMPSTHFHFAYVHETESEISGIGRLFDLVCRAMDGDSLASCGPEDSYFVVLNRPVPFHENALSCLGNLAESAQIKNSGCAIPCVAFKDSTDTSMSLAPVPTSRMAIMGAQLQAFFASGYCAQAKRLNLRLWDSALSMFATYYIPGQEKQSREARKEGPKALYATMWPYTSAEESMTLGLDASKQFIEFLADGLHIPEVIDFLMSPDRLKEYGIEIPMEKCREPRFGCTYDETVPICEKPRALPYWNPSPKPFDELPPLCARVTYFTILYEACKLNTLASFKPCHEKLKSPAMIMATIKPPKSVALFALEFVCDTQKWALGRCIEAMQYKKTPSIQRIKENGASTVSGSEKTREKTQLGGKCGTGVLRQRNVEAGL